MRVGLLLWFLCGTAAGAVLGGWGQRAVSVPPPEKVPARVTEPVGRGVPAAAPSPAATEDPFATAKTLGCECPVPVPAGMEARYLEAGVEAWVDELTAACPAFAERGSSLDCSEWPCLLFVGALDGEDGRKPEVRSAVTCGLDHPHLESSGSKTVDAEGRQLHVFSVRPEGELTLELLLRERVRVFSAEHTQ